MGRIISIANFKGGVGKTATAFNLAAALWVCGKSVCLVDCDDQADLTFRMNCILTGDAEEDHEVETLYGWLKRYDNLSDDILPVQQRYDRFYFIPSRSTLSGIQMSLQSKNQKNDDCISNYYVCLKDCLEYIRGMFDYIILDCPPTTGFINTCALIATDEVIIPVNCSSESMDGVDKVCQRIDGINSRYKKHIDVRGCLLTCYQANHNVSKQFISAIEGIQKEAEEHPELKDTHSRYQLRVIDKKIRVDKNFKECATSFANIFEYQPYSKGAYDYMELAKELYGVKPPMGWKQLSQDYWAKEILPSLQV